MEKPAEQSPPASNPSQSDRQESYIYASPVPKKPCLNNLSASTLFPPSHSHSSIMPEFSPFAAFRGLKYVDPIEPVILFTPERQATSIIGVLGSPFPVMIRGYSPRPSVPIHSESEASNEVEP